MKDEPNRLTGSESEPIRPESEKSEMKSPHRLGLQTTCKTLLWV